MQKCPCLAVCLFTLTSFAQQPTPKHPVTDQYFDVKVTDDYRWLENWDDPEVNNGAPLRTAFLANISTICPPVPPSKSA